MDKPHADKIENVILKRSPETPSRLLKDHTHGVLNSAAAVVEAMRMLGNEEQRRVLMCFFKTGKGQYGEGDEFLGVRVPETRKVVKVARNLPLGEVQRLLESTWHEVRLCGFLVLVSQFERAVKVIEKNAKAVRQGKMGFVEDAIGQCDAIAEFYVSNARRANNWDLVDLSCGKILGRWLLVPTSVRHEDKVAVLDRLAMSDSLWERRISMVSTMATTMAGDPSYALKYAELHLKMFKQRPEWSHDLMHKAVGWMLREVGKRCDMWVLRDFLSEYAVMMPRTALRYAIEHMDEDERRKWMMVGRE